MNIIKDKTKIVKWLNLAKDERFDQVVTMYNESSNMYYPIFCSDCKKTNEIIDSHLNSNDIQEVYDMNLNLNDQLEEKRAFHYNKVLTLKK